MTITHFNLAIMGLILIIVTVFPFMMIYYIEKNKDDLTKIKKFKALWGNSRTDKTANRNFVIILYGRKVIFAVIIVALHGLIVVQVTIF
jgi:hypothetical protein